VRRAGAPALTGTGTAWRGVTGAWVAGCVEERAALVASCSIISPTRMPAHGVHADGPRRACSFPGRDIVVRGAARCSREHACVPARRGGAPGHHERQPRAPPAGRLRSRRGSEDTEDDGASCASAEDLAGLRRGATAARPSRLRLLREKHQLRRASEEERRKQAAGPPDSRCLHCEREDHTYAPLASWPASSALR